jgi:putative oxidoreductase
MAAQSKAATVIGWILQVWLAVVFVFAGSAKLAGTAPAVQMYNAIGWGQWFRYVTGAIEVGSAILLLVPALTVLGALLLTCTMVGAVVAHLTVLHSPPTGPVALILLSGAIIWNRGFVLPMCEGPRESARRR